MLFQAAVDIPARKQQIAVEKMRSGGFLVQPGAFGNALHGPYVRQGAVDIIGYALDRCHTEERPAAPALTVRQGQRLAVCDAGFTGATET